MKNLGKGEIAHLNSFSHTFRLRIVLIAQTFTKVHSDGRLSLGVEGRFLSVALNDPGEGSKCLRSHMSASQQF